MQAWTYYLTHYAVKVWEWLIHPGLPLAALAVLCLLIPRVGRLAVRLVAQRLDEEEERTKSTLALAGALVYLLEAVAFFIVGIRALTLVGVPATSAAVPATVVSAAIGFGAQNIIGDFLSGVFVITERQFGVGDYVSFEGTSSTVEGTVVALTLRATKLRTASGEMVTVPNGKLGAITNYSQDWSRAFVEIDIPLRPGENIDELISGVETATQRALDAQDIKEFVIGEADILPSVAVVQPQAAGQPWAVTFRVTVDVIPAKQWAVERAIRSAVLDTFWDRMEPAPYSSSPGSQPAPSPWASRAPEAAETDPASKIGELGEDNATATQVFPHTSATTDSLATPPRDSANGSENELALIRSKNDGPGTGSELSNAPVDPGAIPEAEAEEDAEEDTNVFRRYEYDNRLQRWLTFGGRTRTSTSVLLISLVVLGFLAVASSNPDDGKAGVLNPAYWNDRPAKTSTPTVNPESPTQQPTQQQDPTQQSQEPHPTDNSQNEEGTRTGQNTEPQTSTPSSTQQRRPLNPQNQNPQPTAENSEPQPQGGAEEQQENPSGGYGANQPGT